MGDFEELFAKDCETGLSRRRAGRSMLGARWVLRSVGPLMRQAIRRVGVLGLLGSGAQAMRIGSHPLREFPLGSRPDRLPALWELSPCAAGNEDVHRQNSSRTSSRRANGVFEPVLGMGRRPNASNYP